MRQGKSSPFFSHAERLTEKLKWIFNLSANDSDQPHDRMTYKSKLTKNERLMRKMKITKKVRENLTELWKQRRISYARMYILRQSVMMGEFTNYRLINGDEKSRKCEDVRFDVEDIFKIREERRGVEYECRVKLITTEGEEERPIRKCVAWV
jgi:hypothetical protein